MSEIERVPQLDTAMMPIYQEFAAEHSSWIPDFDVWSYLNLRADSDLAAAFSKLFWPDFVEVEGCVFFALKYNPDNYVDWKKRLGGARPQIEEMINHVHIWDLFMNERKDVNESLPLHEYLAQALAFSWKAALQAAFPEKRFVVSYATAEEGYGPEVTFCQEPD